MAPTFRPHAAILPPDSLNVSNTTDLSRFALLVTTFNSPEREALYTPRLQWWLYNSALDLFVVDSAGRCFPAIDAPRFRCFAFNQSADPLLAAWFVAPCCVRPRAEALPHTVAASPTPSVYRLPPMQVPEEWRTKRGDGSTLSELLATGNASAAPWTRARRDDVVYV